MKWHPYWELHDIFAMLFYVLYILFVQYTKEGTNGFNRFILRELY